MNIIKVVRVEETENATISELFVNGSRIGYALEPAWQYNAVNKSCIPPGRYDAFIRDDEYSRWDYDVIQLVDVFNRSAIQIHIGNFPRNTQGCILPGKGRGTEAVWSSKDAFLELINKLDLDDKIEVVVKYDHDKILKG
jgi:hypothetical protein